mmetsp:Transcript_16747/g.39252  ORF Transcript_16747/g.39252 Transcript_16747/m.39252 type:complete len:383 (+) Transcript_16747:74-1222(+)|eukprot:CAMPEP_0171114298 /NCGR_PEP_ID=MMETSP0766_2-20121228/84985_1 /TAXON_ID=439317 /ORGANISM="Gambierdiscus australes, Strain CAWD 149" /LENGTH=382 /DNA_ID=CAMNT_0011576589 /DNA_START=56 /DNA_END=1204 /DNA_ORIENTATION=-
MAESVARALPLLKFEARTERPVVHEEGLAAIRQLPGPVCPVAFVGDGRSGKSYLASKIVGDGTFPTDDSATAVTEGIDVAVLSSKPGHLVVFDCEGGNNALSRSHSIVTVVGALLTTALVFVTDGKASEAAVEALARMLQERSLIKCDGTGALQAQSLLFVVNQNRLRYSEHALEEILASQHDAESAELRGLISAAYPPDRRHFFCVPSDGKGDFAERWERLHQAIREAAQPLKMGKLWMTGMQVAEMISHVEQLLRKHGSVSLPSLHRHVILDSWLKPTVGRVLASRLDKLSEDFPEEQMALQSLGVVRGDCSECGMAAEGWLDPDVDDFFCEECWRRFSPTVLKCGFCSCFSPWPCGRVEQVSKMWHCMDCLMQLGVDTG